MKELLDMAEAHLQNVRKEIDRLVELRNQIDNDLSKLKMELEHGALVVKSYSVDKAECADADEPRAPEPHQLPF